MSGRLYVHVNLRSCWSVFFYYSVDVPIDTVYMYNYVKYVLRRNSLTLVVAKLSMAGWRKYVVCWSVISENGKNASTRTRTEILQLTRLIALPLSY